MFIMSISVFSCPPGQSIKTRVEAYHPLGEPLVAQVRLDNPLKQGLKPPYFRDRMIATAVRLDNPLKQGLKHTCLLRRDRRGEVRLDNPLKQGLKHV